MNWLEISLSVDGELAEAIAEILSRHIQQGVATELEIDEVTRNAYSGKVIVRGYLPADGHEETLKETIENDLWHLRQIQDFPEPTYQLVQQQDWNEQWRQHYHPMPVGERLLLVPAWYEPIQSSRQTLILDPGMAFGTGSHPSTRLSIEAIEKHIQSGDRVYDVGCGSGILSIASLLMGAREVIALDIDPAAIASTQENAKRNQVLDKIQLFHGSVEDYLAGQGDKQLAGELVVANILANVLIDMLHGKLPNLIEPESTLVLSGILAEQVDEVLDAARAHDLVMLEAYGEKDWRALVFKKKELPPRRGSSISKDDAGG